MRRSWDAFGIHISRGLVARSGACPTGKASLAPISSLNDLPPAIAPIIGLDLNMFRSTSRALLTGDGEVCFQSRLTKTAEFRTSPDRNAL